MTHLAVEDNKVFILVVLGLGVLGHSHPFISCGDGVGL